MFGALDISTSALVAQRTRMTVIAANLANRNATHDADGDLQNYFCGTAAATSEQ